MFVVQGDLPLVNIALAEGQSKDRILMWVDSPVASRKGSSSASAGAGASQLVDRGSGQRLGGDASSSVLLDNEEDDLEAAIALSLAKPKEPSGGASGGAIVVEDGDEDDEDMKAAIALSIQAADPSS